MVGRARAGPRAGRIPTIKMSVQASVPVENRIAMSQGRRWIKYLGRESRGHTFVGLTRPTGCGLAWQTLNRQVGCVSTYLLGFSYAHIVTHRSAQDQGWTNLALCQVWQASWLAPIFHCPCELLPAPTPVVRHAHIYPHCALGHERRTKHAGQRPHHTHACKDRVSTYPIRIDLISDAVHRP